MNNFLFGNPRYQYYETICGGAGAGPDFPGSRRRPHPHDEYAHHRSGESWSCVIRSGSSASRSVAGPAAPGRYRGGDGVVRAIRALEPMTATLVASRRTVAPFGLAGGGDGATGRQWVERSDGATRCDGRS